MADKIFTVSIIGCGSRGAMAYTVVDVSARPSETLVERLRGLDNIYRVRLLLPQ